MGKKLALDYKLTNWVLWDSIPHITSTLGKEGVDWEVRKHPKDGNRVAVYVSSKEDHGFDNVFKKDDDKLWFHEFFRYSLRRFLL